MALDDKRGEASPEFKVVHSPQSDDKIGSEASEFSAVDASDAGGSSPRASEHGFLVALVGLRGKSPPTAVATRRMIHHFTSLS
jgi:hypothetical protein